MKLICKWKEGLSKVHQLRDHIGAHEYKTVWLTHLGSSGDRESKFPLMDITWAATYLNVLEPEKCISADFANLQQKKMQNSSFRI